VRYLSLVVPIVNRSFSGVVNPHSDERSKPDSPASGQVTANPETDRLPSLTSGIALFCRFAMLWADGQPRSFLS
jgi:hypothetical protein